jgi:integrase
LTPLKQSTTTATNLKNHVQNQVVRSNAHRLIFQVDEGHNSKQTADKYRINFKYFLDYIHIYDHDVLLDLGKEAIQELVIKYAMSLRDNPDKKYARGTVSTRIAPLFYFFENNDIELNRRKIKRYYPSDESVNDDRPYTVEEKSRMLSVCDLRTKAMILLMASSGVRVGSLHTMIMSDLTPLQFGISKLYKVQVYGRTRARHITFMTPEATKAIDEYLEYRKRCGEELKDKSPLFRKHFNKDDQIRMNLPKFMSEAAVIKSLVTCLNRSGVKTSEAMRTHAFRKGFKSICEQSGMKSINVEMLLGHDIGVSGHYYRPADSDILEDYMTHAADALTISNEHRLKNQMQQQEIRHTEEWNALRAQIEELKGLLPPS